MSTRYVGGNSQELTISKKIRTRKRLRTSTSIVLVHPEWAGTYPDTLGAMAEGASAHGGKYCGLTPELVHPGRAGTYPVTLVLAIPDIPMDDPQLSQGIEGVEERVHGSA